MPYQVPCECGKSITVTGADAGASVRCGCGKTVEVPPLHKLRKADGEASVPILVQVRTQLVAGQLPGTRDCACCGQPNSGMMRVAVACEHEAGSTDRSGVEKLGCLLLPFFFGWLLALIALLGMKRVRKQALDVAVVLPLPVCEACQPKLHTPDAIRQALSAIPMYESLLRHYPQAQVSRRG
ncbi:hypothetical protein [Gemmata sp.]|uniref:hypothetical protein n=1 Tax=Gemmata sp. TaxID=1914242 RepID=UPI003F719D97